MSVDVWNPKGPHDRYGGARILDWARAHLRMAGEIIDNPGGGLVFATQTVGQVRAGLAEAGPERWAAVVALLDEAEAAAVRREYAATRRLLQEAIAGLVQATV